MLRRDFLKGTAALAGSLPLANAILAAPPAGAQTVATGRVTNKSTGKGIGGVMVSNGLSTVKTDSEGRYQIPVGDDATIFVIKPRGFALPLDGNNLPQHYYHHKPNGSPATRYEGVKPTGKLPESLDFELTPQREPDRFKMILFGDPQPRNQQEIDYMSHDVIEQVVRDESAMEALFGLSLGDIMFDNLQFYEALNQSLATIGKPWYSTVGNHDLNYDSPDNDMSTETFRRVYGHNYYAFEYGPVFFAVLDNVFWDGSENGYHGEIPYAQLAWLKAVLKNVPKEKLLVLAMHIPIWSTDNREELFRLIEDRPYTLSFSAHTHYQRHDFLSEKDGWRGETPHHHLNHATVCGCWWGGTPDERGIPHATMSDGAPNGYSIVEFDKTKYKVVFRPASRPTHEQMAIYLPEEVSRESVSDAKLLVNVFAGSQDRSKVEASFNGGQWMTVPNAPGKDPYIQRLKELEGQDPKPLGRPVAGPEETPHMWQIPLPGNLRTGLNTVDVRTIDMFGHTFVERRTFRVV